MVQGLLSRPELTLVGGPCGSGASCTSLGEKNFTTCFINNPPFSPVLHNEHTQHNIIDVTGIDGSGNIVSNLNGEQYNISGTVFHFVMFQSKSWTSMELQDTYAIRS